MNILDVRDYSAEHSHPCGRNISATADPRGARVVERMVEDTDFEVGLRGYRVVDAGRAAERRRQVLAAAARVFSNKSYDSATVDDIAQELGVSKGVVYYQFRTKEEIFTEILVTAIGEALRRLKTTNAAGGSPRWRLERALEELVAFNLDEDTTNYYAMMVIGNVRALTGANRARVRELQIEYQRLVMQIIDEGVAAGEFRVANVYVSAMNVLTGANGASNWFRAAHAVPAEAVAAQVSAELVRGILAR